jgi:hypothetical protein
MPFDAFISYSSKDQAAADATVAALEAEGIRCWIAHRNIPFGTPWGSAIFQGIDQCRVMVLVFSSRANSSAQISREIARAALKEMPIIPIRIEQVEPSGDLGYYLSGLHWLDTINPPQQEKLRQLAKTIAGLLKSNTAGPDVVADTTLNTTATTTGLNPRKAVIGATAATAAVVIGATIYFVTHGAPSFSPNTPELPVTLANCQSALSNIESKLQGLGLFIPDASCTYWDKQQFLYSRNYGWG